MALASGKAGARAARLAAGCMWILAAAIADPTWSRTPSQQFEDVLAGLPPAPTGILYDRVLPLSPAAQIDGNPSAPPAGLAAWRQMYDEMRRASVRPPGWPGLEALREVSQRSVAAGIVPLAFLDCRYDRIRPDALEDGSLRVEGGRLRLGAGSPFVEHRLFAAAALVEHTHHGERVVFDLDPSRYVSNTGAAPSRIEIDFGDGDGFRAVPVRGRVAVRYASPGRKFVRARVALGDGTVLHAGFPFDVVRLVTPAPHDTLQITASVPYAGIAGTGEAYVYLADGHAAIARPVVVVEGFDLDNTMNWDELYTLLDQQSLLETLRAAGFDAVVLNFTDATDYIQRNALVVAELVRQVQDSIDPRTGMTLVGASMGGLAARYALAFLETSGVPHRVRTFISFDAPQSGANIPLGMQYWLDFFADQSADAAYLLSRLDTPAARQMLVYHHTNPPGTTGESDPLRGELLGDLAAVGGYPASPRKVAIANGSGSMATQGFTPGEQVVAWHYDTFLVDIVGDVWAVPAGNSHVVFEGLIRILLPVASQTVTVSGTFPWDNAPGGWRASMAEMDSSQAPYGDIIALHPNHCFIPTISALDLATTDPFYDVTSDADLLEHTPFDAVYFPLENQEHVTITPESAEWFLQEILAPTDAGAFPRSRVVTLHPNFPNPFNPTTTIRFELPASGHARLSIHDARGARVATLLDQAWPAGSGEVRWDGRDAAGRPVASGVYFYRLESVGRMVARKMTLLP